MIESCTCKKISFHHDSLLNLLIYSFSFLVLNLIWAKNNRWLDDQMFPFSSCKWSWWLLAFFFSKINFLLKNKSRENFDGFYYGGVCSTYFSLPLVPLYVSFLIILLFLERADGILIFFFYFCFLFLLDCIHLLFFFVWSLPPPPPPPANVHKLTRLKVSSFFCALC